MNVKSLICIAVLALSGCTQSVESTKPPPAAVKTPEAPTLPVEPLPAAAPDSEAPVTVLGEFSNRKGDGEHAWGYSVDLWKHEGRIIGMICGTQYLMLNGSPPTGLLENVQYDPKTGRMSFSAKLSAVGSPWGRLIRCQARAMFVSVGKAIWLDRRAHPQVKGPAARGRRGRALLRPL